MTSTRLLLTLALLGLTLLSACSDPDDAPLTPDTGDEGADMLLDEVADAADAAPDLDALDALPDQDVPLEPIALPERPWDINKMGPYNIGYQTTSLSYDAVPDEPGRRLNLVMWYPTRDPSGLNTRYYRVLRRPGIITEASLDDAAPLPVMVFSHGNSSLAEQSYYLTEYFASHGWVVLAPNHTHNTVSDTPGSINYRSALTRPQDISAVLDWLDNVPEGHFLHGRTTDQVVLSGHSFGGYTTLASAGATFAVDTILERCERQEIDARLCAVFSAQADLEVFARGFKDPRVKLAISHTPAGADFFRDGVAQIDVPTLIMTGALDRSLPNVEEGDPIWAELPQGRGHLRLDFKRGGHFTFSNMCELFPTIELVAEDGCGPEFIPLGEAIPMMRLYAMAFARYHLLADMSHAALLAGQEQPYEAEIDLSTR